MRPVFGIMLNMRTMLFIIVSVALSALSACSIQTAESRSPDVIPVASPGEVPAASDAKVRSPVLVELFTSEGCSSCPPADRELTFLETKQPVSGADVITLSFHVDYWDSSAWKDAFSSAEFSERQNQYVRRMKLDSSYTPQMVVDGQAEFVGSDSGRASETIAKAANKTKEPIEIKLIGGAADIGLATLPIHDAATIYLATAEDGLASDVKGGENGGRRLQHVSVVRRLDVVGQLTAAQNTFKSSAKLSTGPAWKKENVKYIVFAQEDSTGRVIAIGKVKAGN